MESKSNRGIIIFLVIFVLLSLILGGYIIYDKFLVNIINEKIVNNSDKFDIDNVVTNEKIKIELTELIKKNGIELIGNGEKSISNFNTLKNSDKLSIVNIYNNYNNVNYIDGVEKSTFVDGFKSIFKQEISYTDEDLSCCNIGGERHCHIVFKENESKYYYNEEAVGHGGVINPVPFYTKAINLTMKDNQYILTTIQLYSDNENEAINNVFDRFSNIKKSKILFSDPNSILGEYEAYDPIKYFEDNYKLYVEKTAKHQYTFEKSAKGKYLLTGYKFIG